MPWKGTEKDQFRKKAIFLFPNRHHVPPEEIDVPLSRAEKQQREQNGLENEIQLTTFVTSASNFKKIFLNNSLQKTQDSNCFSDVLQGNVELFLK
jgi:hypothetical protein